MRREGLGSALGALGAVLLLTAPLTWFFTAPSPWTVAAKAGLGLIGLVAFAILRPGGARGLPEHLGGIAVALVAVVAVVGTNLAATRLDARWDLTLGRIHSLAPQTMAALAGLPQRVEITALVPATHPARDALEGLLREYARESHGKVSFVLADPRKDPALAAKHGLREGEMAVVLEREDHARTALGAVSEAELTQGLLRLSRTGGLRAYFLQGHGEAPPEVLGAPVAASARPPLRGLSRSLEQEGYLLAPLPLEAVDEVPRDADTVLLLGPQTPFGASEAQKLDRYLAEGGHAALFLEPGGATGLEELLARWGVVPDPGVVAEPPPPGVDNAYVILSSSYGEHPVSRVLRQGGLAVQLVTSRALTLLREGLLPGVKVEPVVLSGPNAWEESEPDASPKPTSGEKVGRLVIGAAARRALPGARSPESRLFVLGEADLVRDVLWGHEPNRNLVLSAIAWTADPAEGGVAIRPVDRAASSLELSPLALRQLRFWAGDFLPLALFAAALLWMRRR